jgi:glycosyltransferase involved in cell wall biosynthesis
LSWVILTGEYPPSVGGLADHVHQLASALAQAGDGVDVWSPAPDGWLAETAGVRAHPLPDRYGPKSLLRLQRELAKRPDARVLVEYVPHAYGMKAMNVPFVAWLATRRRPIWIMFQEVATDLAYGAPWRLNVLGLVTHVMAAVMARTADRLFVSTPAWNEYFRRLAPRIREPVWLPDPSNVPDTVAVEDIDLARRNFGLSSEDVVIGCFGTYGFGVIELLLDTMPALLAKDRRRVALLIGRGSAAAAERLRARCPPGSRVLATGTLDLPLVAAHLAVCAVVVQPFPDGVTTRRTSAMASLGLGVPLVTNAGRLTESLWMQQLGVCLASEPSAAALLSATEGLLSDPARAAALGARGRDFYRSHFSFERVVRTLRST